MRDAKKRSLLSTRQWVLLELLLLANGLLVAVFGVLAFSDSFAGVRIAGRAAPTQVIALALPGTAAPVSTSAPLAGSGIPLDAPTPIPSPAVPLTATRDGQESSAPTTPSNTPTSIIPGLSATPAPTSTGIQLNAATAPEKVLLEVAGRGQSLPLSCESRSAADWAAFFGVAIDELEFFGRLPLSDNPEVGFAGDVNGKWGQVPPGDYGVHAAPVAALLREYGLSAEARRGMTWETLQAELLAGRPVVAWVVGHVWSKGKPVEYIALDGTQVTVAPYEHTILVVGFSDQEVVIRDGARLYSRPITTFLGSWAVLGNMAITAGS
jgi:uncharacterized protein YvpB